MNLIQIESICKSSIHSLIGIPIYGYWGCISFTIYLYLYYLARYDNGFQKLITPKHYVKSREKSYELVAYGMSTINALMLATVSTMYLIYQNGQNEHNAISNALDIVYSLSMGYYYADICYICYIAYIINSKNLMQNIFYIVHHLIVIYYQYYVMNLAINIEENVENNFADYADYARYYLSYVFIAEYAVLPLNYGWYLIQTNQSTSKKFIINGVITLVVYCVSRVINLTNILINVLTDGVIHYSVSLIGIPIILLNYYWFYLLVCKIFSTS